MKKKIIIIITLLLVLSLGITLAWWRWQSTTNTNVSFTVEGVTITYDGGQDIQNIKLIPVSSKEKGETDGTGVAKTITASANKTSYLTLNLDLVTFPSNLADASLVWEIYKGNTKVGNGNFANKAQGDSITLFTNQEINSTTSTYKLYIWIDGNQENPSTMMNQSFVFHLNATATDEAPTSALPDFILNSNAPLDSVNSTYVQNQTPGIDFTQSSSDTNGKGLYIRSGSENNLNPIYYYRGAVENNNVYFANYCWKIVRTTDTGGLKMIYNGRPKANGACDGDEGEFDSDDDEYISFGPSTVKSQGDLLSSIGNSAFNANIDDAKYVGYTYDNNGVETDSTIKGVIDTWYQNNILTNYDSYIEDTVYCNDREEATASEKTQIETAWYETYNKLYKSAVRVKNTTPSLECTNNTDKYTKSSSIGNGNLTYPVGLLTMDEIWLAGVGMFDYTNNEKPISYYLDNGMSWWSLSPFQFYNSANVWMNDRAVGITEIAVSGRDGVRPALSLKPEYNTFTYGNGTTANPYRFVETIPSN